MARTKAHIIPKTSRLCITCNAEEIKEIRKLAIDLEIPERDVLYLALLALIEKYRSTPPKEIAVKGLSVFLESPDSFLAKTNKEMTS